MSHISRITSVGDGSTNGSKKYAESTAQIPMNSAYPASRQRRYFGAR